MLFWKDVVKSNLSFDEAHEHIKNNKSASYITRPDWDGVQFYNKFGEYCILFKDGHIKSNMLDKVYKKKANDWMIVSITDEAIRILQRKDMIYADVFAMTPEELKEFYIKNSKKVDKHCAKIIPYLVEMFAASDVLFKKVNHQEYVDFSLEFSKMDCGHGIDKLLEFCGSIKQ